MSENVPNFQNCARCEKDLKNNKHNSLHLGKNMLGYLSLDIISSSKLTVFLELRSRKTVRFSEQTNILEYFCAKWRLLFICYEQFYRGRYRLFQGNGEGVAGILGLQN